MLSPGEFWRRRNLWDAAELERRRAERSDVSVGMRLHMCLCLRLGLRLGLHLR
jgi:hypothetical protein